MRVILMGCIALAWGIGFSTFARAVEPAARVPVILDTDIGDDIDDTWALAMLLKSPQLEPKLITTTCGHAVYRAKLIAKMLTVAGRTDIPIGLGEGGREGTGSVQEWVKDYQLSQFPGKIHEDGAGAIIDVIQRSPQPVAVIEIGPLHTLAAVLRRSPGIAGKAFFVGMDGSVRKGYDRGGPPSAEYNVAANVAAAQAVLSAPWRRVVITPLDTCGVVNLSGARFQALKASSDPVVKALLENYRIWSKQKRVEDLQASSTLFDAVAVYLAYPAGQSLLEFESLPIVVTNNGMTRIDPAGQKMSVATNWKDLDGYRDLLVRTLSSPTCPANR